MINWSVPIIAFCLAVMLGAWLHLRLQRRSGMSRRRRLTAAALPLPAFILLLSGAGVAWELLRERSGDNMTDLAVAVILTVGAFFALITLVGGLIGAQWARKRAR